ncbi:MAG: ATP-binding protein [Calditrichaeota bacterium]|nr:MAG: ATP-binding protein [Calditrichota bacterium]
MHKKTVHTKFASDRLVISSDFANLPKVAKFCNKISKKANLNEDKSDNLAIAVTELVNNAIIHGNKNDPQKKVTIIATFYADHLTVSVSDQGSGFDPESLKNPTDPENIWKQNGRGIFLVRNLIDKVDIHPTPEGTTVILTEYFNTHQ